MENEPIPVEEVQYPVFPESLQERQEGIAKRLARLIFDKNIEVLSDWRKAYTEGSRKDG